MSFLSLSACAVFQLNTLRGSILEDAVPSTSKHGLARGLPLKEVLEYLVPELNVHCLRLAINTPKVTDQLMKLDEQGVRRRPESITQLLGCATLMTSIVWLKMGDFLFVTCGNP